MSWSPQQEGALRAVKMWLADKSGPQVFRVFGFAGTGKTSIALDLGNTTRGNVVYGAFTGKAASVMRKRGCDDAQTLHSMIYMLVETVDGEPKFALDPDSVVKRSDLVVIDECSMVGPELGQDLLSFGTKVLVLGDPAQLPPVDGAGFFTNAKPMSC